MEKNYFDILNKIECKTEKKKELTYISWSDAWLEVKKLYPESTYTIYENFDGFPFWESKFGIDCKVGVTIAGLEHIVRLPVMDGANKSMKEDAYTYTTKYGEKTVEAATTFDINKTIMRAFAKAIAMHGLGLYVFRGEDLPDVSEEVVHKEKYTKKDFEELATSFNEGGLELARQHIKEQQESFEVPQEKVKLLAEIYKAEQYINPEALNEIWKGNGEDFKKQYVTNNN